MSSLNICAWPQHFSVLNSAALILLTVCMCSGAHEACDGIVLGIATPIHSPDREEGLWTATSDRSGLGFWETCPRFQRPALQQRYPLIHMLSGPTLHVPNAKNKPIVCGL